MTNVFLAAAIFFAYIVTTPVSAGEGVPSSNQLKKNAATAHAWIEKGCPSYDIMEKRTVLDCANKIVVAAYSDVMADRSFSKMAFNSAKNAFEQGMPVYFVLAKDTNSNPSDAVMRLYIEGKLVTDGVEIVHEAGGLLNEDILNIKHISKSMDMQIKDAYLKFVDSSCTSVKRALKEYISQAYSGDCKLQ